MEDARRNLNTTDNRLAVAELIPFSLEDSRKQFDKVFQSLKKNHYPKQAYS